MHELVLMGVVRRAIEAVAPEVAAIEIAGPGGRHHLRPVQICTRRAP